MFKWWGSITNKNMEKRHIGINAGKIWNLLSNKQSWTAKQLSEETGLSKREIYTAIGWLAREDKIEINKTKDGEDDFYLIIEYYF